MSRAPRALVIVALSALLALTGCGGNTGNTPTTNGAGTLNASASPVSTDDAAADQIKSASDCPTSNTKAFAKTRFVANAGLSLGAFHRYLYKPYKAGTFKKGADGRVGATIKGTLATAFIVWRLKHAKEDAEASPALCRAIVAPVNKLIASIGSLSPASGNLGALDTDEGLFKQFQENAGQKGDSFIETDPDSAGGLTSTKEPTS